VTAIIQVHSGKFIDLLNPDPYNFSINDIAHALSQLCRFGGHTKEFYSVANHSILVSINVPAEDALTGLMHDAAEAYCQDLVGPLKAHVSAYSDIEAGIWEALAWRYKLPVELPQSVKDADLILLATEKRDVIEVNNRWDCILASVIPLRQRIHPLSMKAAYAVFVRQFHSLKGKR
jgi:hypothetical protein